MSDERIKIDEEKKKKYAHLDDWELEHLFSDGKIEGAVDISAIGFYNFLVSIGRR